MSYGGNQGGWGQGWGGQQGQPQGQGWPDEQPGKAATIDPLNLTLGEEAVIDHDADATEKNAEARHTFKIERPGHYQFVVVGFGDVRRELKDCFELNPQSGKWVPARFEALSVPVKLGLAHDTRFQVWDQFLLPPDNPHDLRRYNHGSTKPDGSTQGFHAEKFGHFLNRLIGGFSRGQKLPPQARQLKSWLGMPIEAEVQIQKARQGDRVDPATGQPVVYPERAQIKLYSYRTAGQTPPPAGQQGGPPGHGTLPGQGNHGFMQPGNQPAAPMQQPAAPMQQPPAPMQQPAAPMQQPPAQPQQRPLPNGVTNI